ncbi:MAG: class I SAM-dependent methyltransferase [Stellaceae bacterium]
MKNPSELHRDMVAYWTGIGAAAWIERSERTERMLAPVAERLLKVAKPQPGETVLDVGCGLGPTTTELARLVGPSGRAVGLDVSHVMIEEARRRGADLGNLEFIAADAATHSFSAPFADLLFSRFGVMFFGDPTATFANLRKALKPTARVAFACWRRMSENPWMLKPLLAAYEHVPKLPPAEPNDPGPFAFADQDRVTRILTGAGYAAPRFTALDMTVDIAGGAGLDAAVHQAMTIGATRGALQDQPDAVRAAVATAIRAALVPHAQDGKVELPAAVWLVEAG